MINWDILAHPWNWFVIAFATLLLLAILHLIYRNNSQGNS